MPLDLEVIFTKMKFLCPCICMYNRRAILQHSHDIQVRFFEKKT
jgi:hypothetical protein